MRQSNHAGLRVLSMVFAAVPFAFALIRTFQTGDDLRYLWVAIAGLCGAVAAVWVAGPDGTSPKEALVLLAVVFVVATLLGVLTALLLGTKLGPAVVLVGAAFGFCFAVGAALYMRASRRTV
jgi:drug/metabolite transporter (DMT)-like permease